MSDRFDPIELHLPAEQPKNPNATSSRAWSGRKSHERGRGPASIDLNSTGLVGRTFSPQEKNPMTATSDFAKLRAAAFEALRANNGDAKNPQARAARRRRRIAALLRQR